MTWRSKSRTSSNILFHGFFIIAIIINLLNVLLSMLIRSHEQPIDVINTSPPQNITLSKNSNQRKTPIKKDDGISACLLVRDENQNLIEWLAYHYHTLPLTHLLIAMDPASTTDPITVVSRWTNIIDITIWTDNDYMSRRNRGALPANSTQNALMRRHRLRQIVFLRSCFKYHKNHGREWVLNVDPDEYLVMNRVTGHEPLNFFSFDKSRKEWEFHERKVPMTPLEKRKFLNPRFDIQLTLDQDMMKKRLSLPKFWTQTFADYIQQQQQDKNPYFQQTCITLPRLHFGLKSHSSSKKITSQSIPSYLTPDVFKTLRFFRHAEKGNFFQNKYGKTLIHVQDVADESLKAPWHYSPNDNVHRPIVECQSPSASYVDALFRVNHYTGTLEEYTSDKKPHHTDKEGFEKKSSFNFGVSHDMTGWLKSFVKQVGEEKARELLAPLP